MAPTARRAAVLSCLLAPVATAADAAQRPNATENLTGYAPTDTYFVEYGQLYDHIGMLQDRERMRAYHNAIRLNAQQHFKDKVVLDVGTGTGVLALWAAQAGARRVYAIEATSVAAHAEALIAANGQAHVVTVLRGTVENLTVPEPVDVLLSEWMGYFLLREGMVHSVLLARDRWLRPGGLMYPSSAQLLLASMDEKGFLSSRRKDIDDAMSEWDRLTKRLATTYKFSTRALRSAYLLENQDYWLRTAWQGALGSNVSVGKHHVLLDVDMHTVTASELFGWERNVTIEEANRQGGVQLLCGWFDVHFCGRGGEGDAGAEAPTCVELSTAPAALYTHWAQTTLALDPPLRTPALSVRLAQSGRSVHDLNVTLAYDAVGGGTTRVSYLVSNGFQEANNRVY